MLSYVTGAIIIIIAVIVGAVGYHEGAAGVRRQWDAAVKADAKKPPPACPKVEATPPVVQKRPVVHVFHPHHKPPAPAPVPAPAAPQQCKGLFGMYNC